MQKTLKQEITNRKVKVKVTYNKISNLSIFGIKIFELKTKYFERSTDNDDDDNGDEIILNQRIIEGQFNKQF